MTPHGLKEFDQALTAMGRTLARRGLKYELVCIGGASLLLLGLSDRSTRDLDVLSLFEKGSLVEMSELPSPLEEAARDAGDAFGLERGWLNLGPRSLLDFGLPEGFEARLESRDYGGIVLHMPPRQDQIYLKFYAACDHGPDSKHIQDLRRLRATAEELIGAARWAFTHDPSPGFRGEAIGLLRHLGAEVDDETL